MYLFTLVIDAVLPSDDDVMNKKSYTFKKSMQMQNKKNVPVPGIRIPMRAVQNRFMKKG